MLKKIFQRRRVETTFGKYISPELVEKMVSDGTEPKLGLNDAHGEYVLVYLRLNSKEQFQELSAGICDMAQTSGASLEAMMGPLVFFSLGLFKRSEKPTETRKAMVGEMRKRFGTDVKIVHGDATGYSGNAGISGQLRFSFFIPSFDKVLNEIGKMDFGEIKEINP